ncbi:hypothetical protein JTB14_014713 [Gonioctena quinquepunctata]|nr:hypothetical protein JTB14_014713 [Gonioctena quinquepunctata]
MSITESNKKTIGDVYALIQQVNANIEKQIEKLDNEVKSIKTVVELELSETRNKVHAVENENFGLKIRLETVERLGMNKTRTRPILVSFVSQIERQEILWNSQKLKGSRIYIAEDLIEKDQQERKILVDNLKEARTRNKSATIKGGKLIIEGNVHTAEDLKDYTREDTNIKFSPLPERKAQSEPVTPIITIKSFSEQEQKASTYVTQHLENIPANTEATIIDQAINIKPHQLHSTGVTPKKNLRSFSRKLR